MMDEEMWATFLYWENMNVGVLAAVGRYVREGQGHGKLLAASDGEGTTLIFTMLQRVGEEEEEEVFFRRNWVFIRIKMITIL